MKELFVHFLFGKKYLGSYDLEHEFPGERRATAELLASENGVKPNEIQVVVGPKNLHDTAMQDVSKMSVHELIMELRSRSEVVAVQVWQREDVENALETEAEISDPSEELVDKVSVIARAGLESCEHGWEVIYHAVEAAIR